MQISAAFVSTAIAATLAQGAAAFPWAVPRQEDTDSESYTDYSTYSDDYSSAYSDSGYPSAISVSPTSSSAYGGLSTCTIPYPDGYIATIVWESFNIAEPTSTASASGSYSDSYSDSYSASDSYSESSSTDSGILPSITSYASSAFESATSSYFDSASASSYGSDSSAYPSASESATPTYELCPFVPSGIIPTTTDSYSDSAYPSATDYSDSYSDSGSFTDSDDSQSFTA